MLFSGVAWQPCSICSSALCAQVDEARRRGEKLNDLAARFRFSRSALSRHFLLHASREATAYRLRKCREDVETGRSHIHVVWPNELLPDAPPNDIFVAVSYQDPAQERVIMEEPQAEEIAIDADAEAEINPDVEPETVEPEPPEPCAHSWQEIGNLRRCSQCGKQQETIFQPIGPTRESHESQKPNRRIFKGIFGRFGN